MNSIPMVSKHAVNITNLIYQKQKNQETHRLIKTRCLWPKTKQIGRYGPTEKKKKNIVDAMITKLKNKLDAGTHGNQEALI